MLPQRCPPIRDTGVKLITHRDLTLPTPHARPFTSPEWLFEPQYDGYRVLALRDTAVRLVSRGGQDLSRAFPEVLDAVARLPEGTAVDGELVVDDVDDRSRGERLAWLFGQAARGALAAAPPRSATLLAFDVLRDRGGAVRTEPIEYRKARLGARVLPSPHMRPIQPVSALGEWLFDRALVDRMAGIVAKREGSRYSAGRTPDWLTIATPYRRQYPCVR